MGETAVTEYIEEMHRISSMYSVTAVSPPLKFIY